MIGASMLSPRSVEEHGFSRALENEKNMRFSAGEKTFVAQACGPWAAAHGENSVKPPLFTL
jgi:hypothetical protein